MHLHIVANMVNNEGKAINDGWLGLKGKKIAQRLTQKHELRPALEKDLKLTHLERMSEYEAGKYKIYIAIKEQLPGAKTLKELEGRLKMQGIETSYKYKSKTDEIQGISFRCDGFSYKGSEVDRRFSFNGLELTITQSQKQEIRIREVQNKQSLTINKEKTLDQKAGLTKSNRPSLNTKKESNMASENHNNNMLKYLTDPEQKESVARELTEEIKQKRKRKHSLE